MGEARRRMQAVENKHKGLKSVASRIVFCPQDASTILDGLGKWVIKAKEFIEKENLEIVDVKITTEAALMETSIVAILYCKEAPLIISPNNGGILIHNE